MYIDSLHVFDIKALSSMGLHSLDNLPVRAF